MKSLAVLALIFASPAFAAPRFTLDAFEQLLQEHDVKKVEDVLPHLPGELRSRYVIVEDGRGLQQATPEKPRIVMRQDGVFLAFNDEELRNGNSFEAIERRDDGTYEFRRYLFPIPPHEGPNYVVEKNPRLCLNCHGRPGRPLWSPFPFWPGVLGSGLHLGAEERERLHNFTLNNHAHPRYRHLLRAENEEWASRSGMTPAWTVQDELEPLLAKFYARQLAASRDFASDRFALVASLLLCPDPHSFLPPGLPWNTAPTLASYRLEVQADLGRLPPEHRAVRLLLGPGAPEIHARLAWLTGERMLELGRWGGSLESLRFLGGREESYFGIAAELARLDPTLALPVDSYGRLTAAPFVRKQLYGPDYSVTPEETYEHARVCHELHGRIP